ncbi:ATP-grasp domain-containing protein [Catenulispora sp. NL8]|uniref:ATP-grasp domain-containing protein n=1 Tax=Catenulispora pinistramenti TaxID=2705254 RepID=A0ABS5KWX1_9ACTN|nr:ATP-grasp domain-containing protein [Catenulispora pinistramenti]MBS2550567.1 ATP-grasp domain-containing protein [Catenulispora pinistramenti]
MTIRVAIIEPVSSGTVLVERAADLGWQAVVVGAGRPVDVDPNDEAALAEALCDEHRRAPLAGILAGCEYYVPAVARIAAALGLPGTDPVTVDRARDKALMRAAVAAAGLAGPGYLELQDVRELDLGCARIGFPAVVKPVDSCGSMGVRKVADLDQARAAVAAIHAETRLDLGVPLGRRVIIERYIQGPEFSADGYVLDGETVVVAVTRKLLGPEPYFVELGHLTPADLPAGVGERIGEYARAVVAAVGITGGPFHCELRLAGEEPVLMEIAARLPGDRIIDLIGATEGVDLPTVALAAATGGDPAELGAFRVPRARAAGIRFLTADGAAFTGLEGFDDLEGEPWTAEAEVFLPSGAPVPDPGDFRSRVAAVRFEADSPAHALQRWHEVGDRVRVR